MPYLRQVNMLPFRPLDLAALEQIALTGLSDVEQALARKQVSINWVSSRGEARQRLARILALSSASRSSARRCTGQLAADTILRQWLYQNPNLAGWIQAVTISLDEAGLQAIDLQQAPDVLQREFFRRSQRLAFSVTAQGPQQLLVGDIRIDRVATQRDYGVEGAGPLKCPNCGSRTSSATTSSTPTSRSGAPAQGHQPRNELQSAPRHVAARSAWYRQNHVGQSPGQRSRASPFIAASGPQLLQIDTIRDIFRRARQLCTLPGIPR